MSRIPVKTPTRSNTYTVFPQQQSSLLDLQQAGDLLEAFNDKHGIEYNLFDLISHPTTEKMCTLVSLILKKITNARLFVSHHKTNVDIVVSTINEMFEEYHLPYRFTTQKLQFVSKPENLHHCIACLAELVTNRLDPLLAIGFNDIEHIKSEGTQEHEQDPLGSLIANSGDIAKLNLFDLTKVVLQNNLSVQDVENKLHSVLQRDERKQEELAKYIKQRHEACEKDRLELEERKANLEKLPAFIRDEQLFQEEMRRLEAEDAEAQATLDKLAKEFRKRSTLKMRNELAPLFSEAILWAKEHSPEYYVLWKKLAHSIAKDPVELGEVQQISEEMDRWVKQQHEELPAVEAQLASLKITETKLKVLEELKRKDEEATAESVRLDEEIAAKQAIFEQLQFEIAELENELMN